MERAADHDAFRHRLLILTPFALSISGSRRPARVDHVAALYAPSKTRPLIYAA